MKRLINRALLTIFASCTLFLASGCDGTGVTDIVYGALQLAFGIVNVAT